MADSYTHRGYHDSLKQPKGSTLVADGCDHFRVDSGISMSINEEFSSVPCLSTEGTELKAAVKDSQHRFVSVAYDSVITDSFDSCESKLKELQISESCSPHCASSCTTNTLATDLRNSVIESDPIAPSVSTPVRVLSLELFQELFSQDEDGDT
jgi:hypothetical protein